jgi:hypothetical protein
LTVMRRITVLPDVDCNKSELRAGSIRSVMFFTVVGQCGAGGGPEVPVLTRSVFVQNQSELSNALVMPPSTGRTSSQRRWCN